MSSHTLPKMLFACWRCSKFPAGKLVQPRFPKSECDRSCGTNPCLRPICQEFGTLSFHSRCVCAHAMRLGFQLVGIGSFFLGRFGFPCLFLSSNRWIPSAMAISRVYSGGYHHEGLHIDFHVRLRHHLPRRARATHSRHSSEPRSLGNTFGGHRSKCEHLTVRSQPPLCVARVVGSLPRDEHTSRGLQLADSALQGRTVATRVFAWTAQLRMSMRKSGLKKSPSTRAWRTLPQPKWCRTHPKESV